MLLQLVEPGTTPDPHETQDEIAVGIDLGTTHSLAAVTIDGRPRLLRDESGEARLPSIVHLLESGELSVDPPEKVVASAASFKRLMGRGADETRISHKIKENEALVKFVLGERALTPVELSAEVLKALKSRAEKALGQPVQKAVITVPAYFEEAQRSATRDAAHLAGLDVLRLLSEPTAAALAYGLEKGSRGTYLVYDLGGGTFDVSLLTLHNEVFQVKATGGNTHLGGDDFDRLIVDHWTVLEGRPFTTLSVEDQKTLLSEARRAKEMLSTQDVYNAQRCLDTQTLKTLIFPLIQETLALAEGVLRDAKIRPEELTGILLVGGSTRMPLIKEAVSKTFPCPLYDELNPDEVVAMGAALQAHALTYGASQLLLDVTPLSLGLETMGGLVEKIIHRNAPIPCRKTQTFTTFEEGQTAMALHVVQGEREFATNCRSLARFEFHDIPPFPAGIARIEVSFALDADGLLTVSAQEKTTGKTIRLEVKPSFGLNPEEMARMIRQSQAFGREDMEARLLEQKWVDAARLLHDLESALRKDRDLLTSQEHQTLMKAAEELKQAKDQKNRAVLEKALKALHEKSLPFAERRMNRAIQQALQGKSLEDVA